MSVGALVGEPCHTSSEERLRELSDACLSAQISSHVSSSSGPNNASAMCCSSSGCGAALARCAARLARSMRACSVSGVCVVKRLACAIQFLRHLRMQSERDSPFPVTRSSWSISRSVSRTVTRTSRGFVACGRPVGRLGIPYLPSSCCLPRSLLLSDMITAYSLLTATLA